MVVVKVNEGVCVCACVSVKRGVVSMNTRIDQMNGLVDRAATEVKMY